MTNQLSASCADRENRSLLVVAGDLSADKHVAKLVKTLKEAAPDLHVWGMGSEKMQEAGVELCFDCRDFSSMGILSVIKLRPFLERLGHELLRQIERRKPHAVLLVDYGGFNLQFAKAVRKKFPHLKMLYFISPQVWGSRPWRIKALAKTINKMLVIFPFEESLYLSHQIPVRFVGHPLTTRIAHQSPQNVKEDFCHRFNLDPEKPLIAVFPGSRKSEIQNLFPIVWKAMQWTFRICPKVQFAISEANQERASAIRAIAAKLTNKLSKELDQQARVVKVSAPENDNLMAAADIIWAKSGTTALEATLHGKPMIVFYRADWLSYWLFLAFKRVQKISLPNLLAGKDLVPELIQLDCRPDQLVKYTADLLNVPGLRRQISQELLALRERLGQGDYALACTEEILKVISAQGKF